MGTKTEEEVAREAFKQELLHTSNWGLRRLATGPKGAGIEIAVVKEAEETGPEAVVDVIMEKYDEGWRPGGAALNPQSSPASSPAKKRTTDKKPPKEEPKNEPDPEPAPEPEASGDDDPVASAWDEEGSDGLPADLDLDLDDDEPEPEPEPEKPKRRQRQTKTKTAPAAETSALEEKVDKVLDTLMKMASMFSKIEKTLDSIDATVNEVKFLVIEGKEATVTGLAVLFKKGFPAKGFGKVKEHATALAKKACGIED